MYKTRTIIGILIAFALAVAAYGYWMSSPTGALTEPMTHRLVTDFAARDAVGHINLSALKSGGNFKALVNPASLLPHTAEFPPAQLQKVYAFANNCKVSELRGVAAPSLQKTVAWHRFLCGIDPKLSDQFFETGPLFHPSGSSFVFLAVLSNVAVFHDKTWIDRHRDFLHLREYAELAASHLVPEDDSTRILARLSLGAFSEIARENLVILDDRFMLVLQPESGRDFLHREYDAFDAENWRRYLAATPYSVGPARAGSHCALLASDLCWNIDAGKLQRYRLCMAVGGLTASGLLLVLTVCCSRENEPQNARNKVAGRHKDDQAGRDCPLDKEAA